MAENTHEQGSKLSASEELDLKMDALRFAITTVPHGATPHEMIRHAEVFLAFLQNRELPPESELLADEDSA